MTENQPARKLKVAIVGGGPGGLATAIALQDVPGIEVTLYEQASVLREVGAGISISQNSWNVLELLGVADAVDTGHPTLTVINMNARSGEELHRVEKPIDSYQRPPTRTQRTKLQSALLSKVAPGTIKLSKKLRRMTDEGDAGVKLEFEDGEIATANLVVGADGIRSVVRDSAWENYELKFTGTTIWRTLLPWDEVKDLDPRFEICGWWHGPTTHVYFSPVGEGLWEIAARAWQNPATHGASKVSWGTPVTNEVVESNFTEYIPEIQEALKRVPQGGWREFAAFAGPELPHLVAWNNKVVLVGDSSHALSGAFGSGAGFAMEDGWILAQALAISNNDVHKAVPIFDSIRVPYYSRMYAYLESQGTKRAAGLKQLGEPTYDDKVKSKLITDGGGDMQWIYANHIGKVWEKAQSIQPSL